MNKRQMEMQKEQAACEEKVISRLKQIYEQARKDCEGKIRALSMRTDMENLKSIVWQKQYQEALKKQLDSVLNTLNSEEFACITEYLTQSYENGFWGTLYDLQGQGIPLVFPIDQEPAVRALQVDSKLSQGYYKRLGEDTGRLKKAIQTELSRGISNGESWNRMAALIAAGMNSPFRKSYKNAIRIARTEGHRVQNEAAFHCQEKAKAKGADVVKQWDSTLDSRTRPHHVELNGQIRDLEDPFEVAGHKAMYPGAFGVPEEDIHCRCCLLQRARWALEREESYTKWNGDKNTLVSIKAADYNEFKKTAETMSRCLDYRIVNYTTGDYAVKDRVSFLEAYTYLPGKVKAVLENTTVCVGSPGSAYAPGTDTIYVGRSAGIHEIIHEIGHAVEGKLFDKERVDSVRRQCVKGLSAQDIERGNARDTSGNGQEILCVKSNKLLSLYQGRLYVDDIQEALNPDGSINVDVMEEVVSVAVQEYFLRPNRMKAINMDMYNLVDEVMGRD